MTDNKSQKQADKGATFDMYHFFSRKDVVLVALVIAALLMFCVFHFLVNPSAV